jgi:glycosyltransferase involved in cell wall biosynthesis
VTVAATTWRLSLRACLVRTEALRQLGDVHPQFRTLEGASLEMGHRYVVRGGLTRHLPWLAPGVRVHVPPQLPFEDELRFVYHGFGRFWSQWAWLQAVLTCKASLGTAWRAQRAVYQNPAPAKPGPCAHAEADSDFDPQSARVSVLIPTLDRYAYLRKLLDQLRHQTVSPLDIVVIDQTAIERRDTAIADDFGDLPLRLIYRDQPGQCTARNAGLCVAAGDYVLFLDDDVEVGPDLIEAHLRNLHRFRAGASSGVARETGVGTLPEMFTYTRASDVFPTGNTLISKAVLQDSGLFDLAFDRGQRADGDLGTRVYLSGALMILDPQISVIHHHAPSGGLRAHKARVVRYASSRHSLSERHLPSATEIYLAMRYFTPRQVRQELWLRVLGTFSIRGGPMRKVAKAVISLFCLSNTLWETWRQYKQTMQMLEVFPQIPRLAEPDATEMRLNCSGQRSDQFRSLTEGAD